MIMENECAQRDKRIKSDQMQFIIILMGKT